MLVLILRVPLNLESEHAQTNPKKFVLVIPVLRYESNVPRNFHFALDACLYCLSLPFHRSTRPSVRIFRDKATNFVGACNELRNLLQFVKTEKAKNFVAANKCKWNFISVSSPHFGGLWEAGVKSAKTHLRKIVGSTPLSLEELNTMCCQIEACLKSRAPSPSSQ